MANEMIKKTKRKVAEMRNKVAGMLGGLSNRIKAPEVPEPKPLPKSFIQLSSDPSPLKVQDRLYGNYVDQLRQFILSLNSPFVLSISGPWGRGKTFLIERVLDHEAVLLDHAIVRIDAWEIPESEPAMPHVLAQVAEQLGANHGDKKSLLKAGTAVAWVGTAAAASNPLGLGMLAMSSLLGKAVNSISERSKTIVDLRKRFSEMIGIQLRRRAKSNLIIFIDNLDRCSPEQCIGFLDQLAKFLKTKDCVFILALDEDVVEGAIRQRYGSNSLITAGGYLEKIIDLSLAPPVPQTSGLIELLGDRFDGITLSADLRADMRNALKQLEMTPCTTSDIARNPRKMFRILKRIAAYLHFDGITRLEKLNHMLPGLLLMSIIKAYRPAFFEALRKSPQVGTEIILFQNMGRRVAMNGYDLGSIGSGDYKARMEASSYFFRDKSFVNDSECGLLMIALADDFSRRRDVYRSAGAQELHQAITNLVTAVNSMRI